MKLRDQTDLRIIESLRRDPLISNRDLAAEIGVAETTVAARIRGLRDEGVARVVAQLDVRALGFDLICLVDIDVSGKSVRATADEIAQLEEVSSVCIFGGSPAIIAQVNTRDGAHLTDVLYNQIAMVPGVTGISANLIIDIYKFKSEWGTLS